MSSYKPPYTRENVLRRAENLKALFSTAKGLRDTLSKAKNVATTTKRPSVLKIGVGLMLLPEPLTTAAGLPLVLYALSKKNALGLGEGLSHSYSELWRSLSWP